LAIKLPLEEEKKIRRFMRRVRMNCGSLDLILGRDSQYYFLEVNPVGQFGQISRPAGYNIEKRIAEKLQMLSSKNQEC
jgi:glutathione synthase/RimK-type ligase-like ATP-grasp enzyme